MEMPALSKWACAGSEAIIEPTSNRAKSSTLRSFRWAMARLDYTFLNFYSNSWRRILLFLFMGSIGVVIASSVTLQRDKPPNIFL